MDAYSTDIIPYMGMTEQEAIIHAVSNKKNVRVMRRDNEHFAGTADFRMDRINLEIDNGVVTYADVG